MNVTNRVVSPIGFSWRLVVLGAAVAVAIAASQPAMAQSTHLWTQSKLEDFEKGTPQGVALTSDGHLREIPSAWTDFVKGDAFVEIASGRSQLHAGCLLELVDLIDRLGKVRAHGM